MQRSLSTTSDSTRCIYIYIYKNINIVTKLMEIYIWWKYFKILMMQYINLKEGDNDQLLLSFFTSTFQNLDWSTAPPPPSGAPDVEAVFLDLHGRFLLSCQPKASPIFSQSIVARLRYRYIVQGKKKHTHSMLQAILLSFDDGSSWVA
jgi:hypothetical protein